MSNAPISLDEFMLGFDELLKIQPDALDTLGILSKCSVCGADEVEELLTVRTDGVLAIFRTCYGHKDCRPWQLDLSRDPERFLLINAQNGRDILLGLTKALLLP